MRKLLLTILTALVLTLVACNTTTPNVVFSKVYGSSQDKNNLIELYNNSDKEVNLNDYSIKFYNNGSSEVTNTINLTGTIEANGFFVIGGNNFDLSDHKTKIDYTYTTGDLPFNGDDAFELVFKKKSVDQFGITGLDILFSRNQTFIRVGNLNEFEPVETYDKFNYISYLPDMFEYLKNDNYEIKTLDQLYAGPKLEQRYLDLNYSENDFGTGGTSKVSVVSIADGDTATFRPLEDKNYPESRMRYYYVDTPEVAGAPGGPAPWAYVASKYNKEHLLVESQNKEVIVQSVPDATLTDTFGRSLGLVWVNGHLSQFLITSEGLTDNINPTYTSADLGLSYKNVPYLTFLLHAENRARLNGWGMKGYPLKEDGEKAPDWNYSANKNTTSNPDWIPNLPLPWEK